MLAMGEIIEQLPVAAAMILMFTLMLKYLERKDTQVGEALDRNTSAISKMSEMLARLDEALERSLK